MLARKPKTQGYLDIDAQPDDVAARDLEIAEQQPGRNRGVEGDLQVGVPEIRQELLSSRARSRLFCCWRATAVDDDAAREPLLGQVLEPQDPLAPAAGADVADMGMHHNLCDAQLARLTRCFGGSCALARHAADIAMTHMGRHRMAILFGVGMTALAINLLYFGGMVWAKIQADPHISPHVRIVDTDRNRLIVGLVGGVCALLAIVFTIRAGHRIDQRRWFADPPDLLFGDDEDDENARSRDRNFPAV